MAGQSVAVTLDREIDIVRGDLIADAGRPEDVRSFRATVVHLADAPLAPGRMVEVRYGAALVRGRVTAIEAVVDVDTGEEHDGSGSLEVNDVARVVVELAKPLPVEGYRTGGRVGAFLLVDPSTGDTLTAGLVQDR